MARLAYALALTLLSSSGAGAQPTVPPPFEQLALREAVAATSSDFTLRERVGLLADTASAIRSDHRAMPTWVKWGLVGAAGGAIAFGLLGRTTIDREPNPVLQDAALGAVIGFVVIGGSVAVYSWICSPDSRSRRAGLCGR